jgi:hypothetical protein
LILVEILRVTRGCPRVPEEEERESAQPELRGPDNDGDQEQGHIGEHHPVLEPALPALDVQGRLALRT